jgi:hypothetical protein
VESWDTSEDLTEACYCLRCEGYDPPTLPSVALTQEHLGRHHSVAEPVEGRDWIYGRLDEALRARGQLTLDSVVLERFQAELATLAGADDLLRFAGPQG